jgi:predicted dehydrogenase
VGEGNEQRRVAEPPRIAVVGCGAMARHGHLPALARHPEVIARAVLVDKVEARARALASEFGVTRVATDHRRVLGSVDGIVIATPHPLHAPVALDAVRSEVPVLCEKPLTETPREAEQLVAEAERQAVAICANYNRRLYPAAKTVWKLLRDDAIGRPRRLTFHWGYRFAWPTTSGFYFGVGGSRRGVLLDKGSHALDLICWWLGGEPKLVSYHDDSLGGSEAVADVELDDRGCRCHVRLSWLTLLDNTFSIEGDRGRIEGGLFDLHAVTRVSATGKRRRIVARGDVRSGEDLAALLIDNFLAVVAGKAAPLVAAADVLPSIRLLDECYRTRVPFEMPWQGTERLSIG